MIGEYKLRCSICGIKYKHTIQSGKWHLVNRHYQSFASVGERNNPKLWKCQSYCAGTLVQENYQEEVE